MNINDELTDAGRVHYSQAARQTGIEWTDAEIRALANLWGITPLAARNVLGMGFTPRNAMLVRFVGHTARTVPQTFGSHDAHRFDSAVLLTDVYTRNIDISGRAYSFTEQFSTFADAVRWQREFRNGYHRTYEAYTWVRISIEAGEFGGWAVVVLYRQTKAGESPKMRLERDSLAEAGDGEEMGDEEYDELDFDDFE